MCAYTTDFEIINRHNCIGKINTYHTNKAIPPAKRDILNPV